LSPATETPRPAIPNVVMASKRLKSFVVTAAWGAAHAFRRVGPVAVAGYLVVAIFGLAFLFVKSNWPGLQDATVMTIALVGAAPLAIALVWQRLTGVKAFGVELSLAESSVQTNTELVAAITERQYFSGAESIVEQIRNTIVRVETEILEINLRNGDYWWSTRLYLLAALADDHSPIHAFAFVELGIQRKFLGLCTPSAVRKAIAEAFPVLATVYLKVAGEPSVVNASRDERIGAIVKSWIVQSFGGQSELDLIEKVSSQHLWEWLSKAGHWLETDAIEWSGVSDPNLARQILSEYRGSYVALLRQGRLDRIVNRSALAFGLARRAMKS
jgi:hypothetical protein